MALPLSFGTFPSLIASLKELSKAVKHFPVPAAKSTLVKNLLASHGQLNLGSELKEGSKHLWKAGFGELESRYWLVLPLD
jgi:hypothetical protein